MIAHAYERPPMPRPLLYFVLGYGALSVLMSLAAIAAYWLDKRAARSASRRTPEKRLHLLAALGGWPGAWYAQRKFHHKTRKTGFQLITYAIIVLHLTMLAGAIWLSFR